MADKRFTPGTQKITLINVFSGHRVEFVDDGYPRNSPEQLGPGRASIVAALRKRASDKGRLFLLAAPYPEFEIGEGREAFIVESPIEAQDAEWQEERDSKRHAAFRGVLDDVEEKGIVIAETEKAKARKRAEKQ